jgi:putative endopeptidase
MFCTMMRRASRLLALAAAVLLVLAPSAGSATACLDFYAFVNRAWRDAHRPAAGAFSIDRFDLAASAYEDRIHKVLESAAARSGPGNSVRRVVGDLYASCMDVAAIDRTGSAALGDELRRAEDVVDPATLSEELAHLHDRGIDALFILAPGVDPLGRVRFVAEVAPVEVPPAKLALTDGGTSRARAKEAAYVGYGRALFELAGDEPRDANGEADAAFRLQDELLLEGIHSRLEAAEPHPVRVGQLAAVTGAIDWPSYLRRRGLSWMRTLNETAPGYIHRADDVLRTTPVAALRSYLRWRILSGYAPYLSRRFVEAGVDFEAAMNGGGAVEQPRWRRCTEATSALLPERVATLALENPVVARTDRRAVEVIVGIRGAMRGMIRETSWLGPRTRRRIEAKLHALRVIPALPASSMRFEPVALDRSSYLTNVQRVSLLNVRFRFRTLREGDPAALSVSPLSQDVVYLPELNEVYLPPTVLQRPFVSQNRDPASDYGGLGALVAHEFMHSLDEYGRKFDESGRVRPWWTAAEIAAYRKRVSCLTRQFGGYRLPAGTRVDGNLVRDEALADLAGMEIAFRAYRTEQRRRSVTSAELLSADRRFFVAYAQSNAETTRPDHDVVERLDEHAPEHLRVNGTLADMPAFLRAFPCGHPPAALRRIERCTFW